MGKNLFRYCSIYRNRRCFTDLLCINGWRVGTSFRKRCLFFGDRSPIDRYLRAFDGVRVVNEYDDCEPVDCKNSFIQYIGAEKAKKNVIICGSDEYGIMAKHALDNAEDVSYNILAFIDVNDKKAGKVLEGIKIYKMSSLGYLLKRNKVDKVIIAKKMIAYDKKRTIVETCLKYNVNVLEVPRFESWINGDLSIRLIKNIRSKICWSGERSNWMRIICGSNYLIRSFW